MDTEREDDELPEGWVAASVEQVCDVNPGKPAPNALSPDAPVSFVPMSAVDADRGIIATPVERAFASVRTGFTSFQDDDVIMARITPCMENGKAAVARGLKNGLGSGSTEFHVLRSRGAVQPEFVFHYIRQESFREDAKLNMSGNVGQQRVPADFMKQAPVPIPPLAEQKRIVAKVEALLARVNGARARLAKVPVLLKRFRQSVLTAACSGQLTADWREQHPDVEPASDLLNRILDKRRAKWEADRLAEFKAAGKRPKDNKWKVKYEEPLAPSTEDLTSADQPFSWCWASLAQLCAVLDPNPSHRYPTYKDGTIPIVSTQEFDGINGWQVGSAKLVPEAVWAHQNRICSFSPSDIIVARKGRLGLARRPPPSGKYVFSHTVFVVKSEQPELSGWLLWSLRQESIVVWLLREMNSNTGVPTLGKAVFERLPIPLPPAPEQVEIVRRVEALFALADRIEAGVKLATARVEKMTQAILAKAFRGELVPTEAELARREGRYYESASALLARINAEMRTEPISGPRKPKARER